METEVAESFARVSGVLSKEDDLLLQSKIKFWNAWKQSNTSPSKNSRSRYLGSRICLEEKRDEYRRRCSSDENNVDDDNEGGIGAGGCSGGFVMSSSCCRSGGGWTLALLGWFCHLVKLLKILIGWNEREMGWRKTQDAVGLRLTTRFTPSWQGTSLIHRLMTFI